MTTREMVEKLLAQSERFLDQENDIFNKAVWRSRIALCQEILQEDSEEATTYEICFNCGRYRKAEWTYCPYCSRILPKSDRKESTEKNCPYCRATMHVNTIRCPSCECALPDTRAELHKPKPEP